MMRFKCFFILFLLYLGLLRFAQAQQKVGLVLSGGGAKGIAHVGVIKALEEHGIPIHYITGTSMGALVGGLYSIGFSPEEMEQIVTSAEFQKWANSKIDSKYSYYFKKLPDDASWVTLKIKKDSLWRTVLPTGLVSTELMDFVFLEYFSAPSAAADYNFDSLFVPFRCVGADINNNRAVIFKKGDLSKAIRGSISFPFYFEPAKVDNKVILDGGMYNNFPVDVMYHDFAPDVIIGSKAAKNYAPPKSDDLLSQIANIMMENTDYNIPCGTSILIKPDLIRTALTDFSKAQSFIDSGYKATIEKIDSIKLYVDTIPNLSEKLNIKRKAYKEKQPKLAIDNFYIQGLDKNQFVYVHQLLRNKKIQFGKKKDTLYLRDIKDEYLKMVSEDKFESISPKLIYNKSQSAFDLYLDIERKKTIILDFGGNISSEANNQAFVQFRYNIWGKYSKDFIANLYFGKFYSSGKAMLKYDFSSQSPLYLSGSFTSNRWDFFKSNTYFVEDESPSYIVKNENFVNINAGIAAGVKGKIELNNNISHIGNNYYQNNLFSREDIPENSIMNFLSHSLKFERSSLNKKQFANSGTFLLLDAGIVIGKEKYVPGTTSPDTINFTKNHEWYVFRTKYQNYFLKIGNAVKLGFNLDAVYSTQRFFKDYTSTLLISPSFTPTHESKTLFLKDFIAHQYLAGGLQQLIMFNKRLDFRLEEYVFQPYKAIQKNSLNKAEYGKPFNHRYYIGSGSLVFHSPLGPISISVGYYENKEQPWIFSFNLGYIIFNNKSLY